MALPLYNGPPVGAQYTTTGTTGADDLNGYIGAAGNLATLGLNVFGAVQAIRGKNYSANDNTPERNYDRTFVDNIAGEPRAYASVGGNALLYLGLAAAGVLAFVLLRK